MVHFLSCILNIFMTMSNVVPSTTTEGPSTTVTGLPNEQQAILNCLAIIDAYCKGNINLACVTIGIYKLLLDNDISTDAFSTYVDQLSEIDRERIAAAARGGLPVNNPIPQSDGDGVPDAAPAQPGIYQTENAYHTDKQTAD